MALNIKINDFEGPFDVLLHLIKKNKMDIHNVKLHAITVQYLDYLRAMEEMDLDITSEFIIIAATLIEIKSKSLLPNEVRENEDSDEDPSKELINKLIEYNKFKRVVTYFREREGKSGIVFSKKGEIIEDNRVITIDELLDGVTMISLFRLFEKLLSDYYEKQNEVKIEREIPLDTFKIEDKMNAVRRIVKSEKIMRFSSFIENASCKIEVVVSFLAVLELGKLKEVSIKQDKNFDDILVEMTDPTVEEIQEN